MWTTPIFSRTFRAHFSQLQERASSRSFTLSWGACSSNAEHSRATCRTSRDIPYVSLTLLKANTRYKFAWKKYERCVRSEAKIGQTNSSGKLPDKSANGSRGGGCRVCLVWGNAWLIIYNYLLWGICSFVWEGGAVLSFEKCLSICQSIHGACWTDKNATSKGLGKLK